MFVKNKIIILYLGVILTMLMVGLSIVGAFRSYSPVPFMDMWGGVGFFIRLNEGNNAVWWEQHNEHRILLSRLLFAIDFKWFHGTGLFLIVINYVLVGLAAFLFWRILRAVTAMDKPTGREVFFSCILIGWLFLWSQRENFIWSFQSQFFLAQLLPLGALYWLHKSTGPLCGSRHFFVACVLGVASAGTMANGLFALLLMIFYALLTRQHRVRITILITLTIVTFYFYLHDYHSVAGHGSLAQILKGNPIHLFVYLLLYLGSPFYYLFGGEGMVAWYMAFLAGLFFVGSVVHFSIRVLRQSHKNSLKLVLLFFIFYIGITAFVTAVGRAILGVDQALSSRYTTPAVMAWAALFVFYVTPFLEAPKLRSWRYWFCLTALAFLMLHFQIQALRSYDQLLFEQELAALAIGLQVKDKAQIQYVFPDVQTTLNLAEKAAAQGFTVFSLYPLHNARQHLGLSVPKKKLPTCLGHLDLIEEIEGDERFVRVKGVFDNPNNRVISHVIRILDSDNKLVGYAFTEKTRHKADKVYGKSIQIGYRGYMLANQGGQWVDMQGERCQMIVKIPVRPFTMVSTEPSVELCTLDKNNILPGNQWLGTDNAGTIIDGMQVYGSFIHSDADVGSISLKIKRGDKVFYRSGPTSGHQFLKIVGSNLPSVVLPVSLNWSLLDFSKQILPNGDFTIKFSDNGAGWGEWSAIAVKQHANG